jgi:hypothetical protein
MTNNQFFIYLFSKMSKRSANGITKQVNSSQVNSSDPQEESSTSQAKELTVQELIELNTWQFANYVSDRMYSQLIPDLESRYQFMRYLKEYHDLCAAEYEKIERGLPKDRSKDKEFFTKVQKWRKDVLSKTKNGPKFQASRLDKLIVELEVEMLRQEEVEEQENEEQEQDQPQTKKTKKN